MHRPLIRAAAAAGLAIWLPMHALRAQDPWVVYQGTAGPGTGKSIVLVSGDEEYRSEEALPLLGKILARHHGFRCTVLFAVNPLSNEIDPEVTTNIPGLEALASADLMVVFTRFRNLPPEQMRWIVDYVDSGRPIVGLRTATHAFALDQRHPYSAYDWRSTEWEGGFGRQILGETWIRHHGDHGRESTRGILAPGMEGNPILRGIRDGDIWGPTDVYGVRLPLPGDCQPLVLGQVLSGMSPDDPPVAGMKNDPMIPIAWTKTYVSASGRRGRVFTTTMGASQDLASEGLRRLLVNACYWAIGLEDAIPPKANVELVGDYRPSPFRFGGHIRGVRPADLRWN